MTSLFPRRPRRCSRTFALVTLGWLPKPESGSQPLPDDAALPCLAFTLTRLRTGCVNFDLGRLPFAGRRVPWRRALDRDAARLRDVSLRQGDGQDPVFEIGAGPFAVDDRWQRDGPLESPKAALAQQPPISLARFLDVLLALSANAQSV